MTNTQLVQVMGYMGWPINSETYAQFNDALTVVQAIAGGEPRLDAALAEAIAIEAQILTARNVIGSPYAQLLAEAQRQVYQLSNLLGLEIKQKVFR
jgi:hypothetical protein